MAELLDKQKSLMIRIDSARQIIVRSEELMIELKTDLNRISALIAMIKLDK